MSVANELAVVQRCLFGTAVRYCGAPATVHVWAVDSVTMSCTEHAAWWDTQPHQDRHPITASCGLLPARWIPSTTLRDGWCEPDVDGVAFVAHQTAPAELTHPTSPRGVTS
jgi:hypothetical protein